MSMDGTIQSDPIAPGSNCRPFSRSTPHSHNNSLNDYADDISWDDLDDVIRQTQRASISENSDGSSSSAESLEPSQFEGQDISWSDLGEVMDETLRMSLSSVNFKVVEQQTKAVLTASMLLRNSDNNL